MADSGDHQANPRRLQWNYGNRKWGLEQTSEIVLVCQKDDFSILVLLSELICTPFLLFQGPTMKKKQKVVTKRAELRRAVCCFPFHLFFFFLLGDDLQRKKQWKRNDGPICASDL